ncbi:MAG: hypothetical protein GF398_01720 [Chitinivibrionales bacterium]|nr:hypothetical protein [Chitinivibrionales bacterium]
MRPAFVKSSRSPSEQVDMPDVDVTPIMNMFIILIPFLVSMAVFTHLSIIELTLPPNVGAGMDDSDGKPRLKLTVVITPEYLALTRGDRMLDSLSVANGDYNYDALYAGLTRYRDSVDIQDEAILAVRDAVKFKYVVRIMDMCRDAGFSRLGLSSATNDPLEGE